MKTRKRKSLEDRLWAKVAKGEGEDACWVWTASRDSSGYGQIAVRGEDGKLRMRRAHRVSWEIHFGPIPPGEGPHGTCVLHRCDNPPCVNPTHLFLGSHAANVADMNAKGRQVTPPGEAHGSAKLDEFDVYLIRRLYGSERHIQRELAVLFGVSHVAIGHIVNRKSWKHI